MHIYRESSISAEQMAVISEGARWIFSGLEVDIRDPFQKYWGISGFQRLCEPAQIYDTRQPLHKQVRPYDGDSLLYDGFLLQKLLGDLISGEERNTDHIHAILTDLLACTFDDDDWRYHARTVICGTPSIISLSGIVEAPAKPKEYYYLSRPPLLDPKTLREKFSGRFVDYGDARISSAALGYLVQAAFYFISDGTPFCDDRNCRLYNSHWQEDMIRTLVEKPGFCPAHAKMLNKFNTGRHTL